MSFKILQVFLNSTVLFKMQFLLLKILFLKARFKPIKPKHVFLSNINVVLNTV